MCDMALDITIDRLWWFCEEQRHVPVTALVDNNSEIYSTYVHGLLNSLFKSHFLYL
jgi:hypothetical protein